LYFDLLDFSVIPYPMMQHHNVTIIYLTSAVLSTGSTSKASKKG